MRQALLALAIAPAAWAHAIVPSGAVCGPDGCFVPPQAQPQQPMTPVPAAVRQSLDAVARIVHRDARGASLGSGTLVAHDGDASYFLTCAHLFEGPGQTRVEVGSGAVPAAVVAIDKGHDLALLRTPRVEGQAVETAELAGGTLTACGFGSNGRLRCVAGPVTGYARSVGAEAPSVRLRGAVRSGDSGGPVFDTDGRLVAVVWGQRAGETYAMGGGPLRRLLARLSTLGPRTAPIARPTPRTEPNPDDAWRQGIERRLDALAEPTGPWSLPDDLVRSGDLDKLASQWDRRFDRLSSEINVNLTTPSIEAPVARGLSWLSAEPLLAAIAVGGPLGVALWAGRAWLRSRAVNRSQQARAGGSPIAVDSPPPPQQVVPETHYVSYERDAFAKAHQWACEQLARKFPGSVEMLSSLDSLIKQQLNGS